MKRGASFLVFAVVGKFFLFFTFFSMQNLQHFIIFLPLCAVESNEERVIGSSSSNIVILFFLKSVVI